MRRSAPVPAAGAAWPPPDPCASAGRIVDPWPFHPAYPRLRLVGAEAPAGMEPEALADPFVTLGDRGGFSRVLLAEVGGVGDAVLLRLALKLQSDEYPFLPDAAGLTSAAVEAGWRREIAALERCAAGGTGVPALVEVLDRAPGAPAVLPPTFYCKRRRAFFTPPCPACGTPLADLRDPGVLDELGLPRRDRSLARFLACPACPARGETRLWTLIRDPESGGGSGARVGDAQDLVHALGALARRPGEAFPCQGCEHVPGCHPEAGAGAALRLLVPVTFYESRAVALSLALLRWDEAMRLAGGASLQAVARGVATESGRARELDRMARSLARQPAYLFEHDPAGKLGLEVLRVKLALFAQLCRAVAALHRQTGEPHLGLAPGRVLVSVDPESSGLPWLWRLGVRLAGLGGARRRALPAAQGEAPPVAAYERPLLIDPVFAPPILTQAPLADLPAVATLLAATAAGDSGVILELALEADTVDLTGVGGNDVLDLSVVQARPPLSLRLVAVPAGPTERGLRLRTLPVPADADLRQTLAQLVGVPLPRTRFTVQPALHVPVDVHALGMLLLTGLLANAARSAAAVGAAVREVRLRLQQRARAGDDGEALAADAARALASDAFDAVHLFNEPEAHAAAAARVPDVLWRDALAIGIRAVTWARGLGICRDAADFDPQHPEVKTEYLLELVESILRRIDAALFGLPGRDAEVRAALARIAREMKVE
jgi:hypothetical protein